MTKWLPGVNPSMQLMGWIQTSGGSFCKLFSEIEMDYFIPMKWSPTRKCYPAIYATRTGKQSLSRLASHLGAKQGRGPKLGGKVTYTNLQNGISTLNYKADSTLEIAKKADISQNKVGILSIIVWIAFYTKICKQNNGIFYSLG